MNARRGWRRSLRAAVAGTLVLGAVTAGLAVTAPAAQALGEVQTAAVTGTAVTGQVTDGSGHGWPLYAKVTVAGVPDAASYTEPATGRYSVSLPAGASYELKFEPVYPGYQAATATVDLGADAVTRDVAVPVDASTCRAGGYAPTYAADFDDGALPAGWTVVDHNGGGGVWRFDDSRNRGNHTGGSGEFAIVDSDYFGAGNNPDTSLVSPVLDLSDQPSPVIGFSQDFNYRSGEITDVDLSLDGGTTWANVLRQTAELRGPRATAIPVPQAAGQPDVRVRFHYYNANFDQWWQLDNVYLGERPCDPKIPGAYLVGEVTDANTGAGLTGATVTAAAGVSVKTAATPDDPALGDGFYWAFTTSTGPQDLTAAAADYSTGTSRVDVSGVTRTDFRLTAGRLAVTPGAVESTMRLGEQTATRPLTFTNTGSAPARVRLGENRGDFVMQRADGETRSLQQIASGEGAPLQRLDVPVSMDAAGEPDGTDPAEGPAAAPWTAVANFPQNIMDNRVVRLDGRLYSVGGTNGGVMTPKVRVYDPATLAWTEAAPLPAARSSLTAGVVGGRIVATSGWTTAGVQPGTWVYEPLTDTWTAAADNPLPRAATGQAVLDGRLYAVGGCTSPSACTTSAAVLAYDAAADTWQRLADYPLAVAYASCGTLDGQVVCTGGNDGTAATNRTYAYDPDTGTWTRLADAPRSTWGSAYAVANGALTVVSGVQDGALSNAAYAYDRATNSWGSLPNANAPRYRGGAVCGFYKIGGATSGVNATTTSEALPGFDQCDDGTADRPWLSVDRTDLTLAPGESATVQVTMDARVDQPGTYTSSLWVHENTPYAAPPAVPVTMTVTPPPSWGKLLGVVRGVACNGTSGALAGATVVVESSKAGWTFTTGADGSYAYWIDRGANPLNVYGSKDGYRPQSRTVTISGLQTTTVDFDLARFGC
ncbi:kelch repeat-containing protein [Streptomyces sp. NPDC051940]|uniref:kelch repeat-containing protein n=1 Tax=Streptomyces sp. NPDC051940 TaxID=3155675 RepID=UPI00343C8BC9